MFCDFMVPSATETYAEWAIYPEVYVPAMLMPDVPRGVLQIPEMQLRGQKTSVVSQRSDVHSARRHSGSKTGI